MSLRTQLWKDVDLALKKLRVQLLMDVLTHNYTKIGTTKVVTTGEIRKQGGRTGNRRMIKKKQQLELSKERRWWASQPPEVSRKKSRHFLQEILVGIINPISGSQMFTLRLVWGHGERRKIRIKNEFSYAKYIHFKGQSFWAYSLPTFFLMLKRSSFYEAMVAVHYILMFL